MISGLTTHPRPKTRPQAKNKDRPDTDHLLSMQKYNASTTTAEAR